MTRFPIAFSRLGRAMTLLGMGPRVSAIEVADDTVSVRMGWAFHSTFGRSQIKDVAHDEDRVLGWGVHGWRGTWLVNGSSNGIVRIDLDPPARARVVGVRTRLTTLRVSVEHPDELRARLAPD